MLSYYVTQKSNMASKMSANTSKWLQVHNYWLKFDDHDVYPQVFGGKEHIKTIKMKVGHYLTSKSNMVSNMALICDQRFSLIWLNLGLDLSPGLGRGQGTHSNHFYIT